MKSEHSHLVRTWVEEALKLPDSARDAWLTSASKGHHELLSDAQTLLGVIALTASTFELSPRTDDDGLRALDHKGVRHTTPVVGQRLAHYHLVDWLGAGGMGEVFRARDTALGRDAAIKLLPRRFTPALRVRLLREAEASSRLQHPAIATFYEAGEDAGEAFIAMEYVHGVTLRRRLADGPLPIGQALALIRCLLEALQHAHAAGILHRDIKPENIMVTGEYSAKLLDFGLARNLVGGVEQEHSPARLSTLSSATENSITGTVGYMAPEQLRGEALDARTDVFQVGAVLYELLAGCPAFPGASPFERIASVMLAGPDLDIPALATLPRDLRAALRRALARDATERYESAASFLADLEDLADGRLMTKPPNTVAVLDLERLGDEQEMAWVATAVAESMTTALSHAPGVTIVSRERLLAALKVVGPLEWGASAVAVGHHLGCSRVISGWFRSSHSSLSITMQLHNVSTGRVAATKEVRGSIDDLIALENALAHDMTAALGLTLSLSRVGAATSVEAHECFARARRLLDGLSKGAVDQARELLNRAVALDPNYAPALAALANAHGFRSIATTDPEDLERAVQFADRAAEADPVNSEAFTWKGYALMRQSRFADAAVAYRRATELDPTHAPAPYFAGSSFLFLGRIADALPLLQRAVDLDPRLGMPWLGLGAAHLSLGQLREARYSFGRAQDLEGEPIRFETAGAEVYVAEVLRVEGRCDEARARVLQGLEAVERSDHVYRDTFRAYALVVLGQTALNQGDVEAARAAFGQVLAQAQGRPRTRSCGQLVVRAMAGLAAVTTSVPLYKQAALLYTERATYNFEPFFGALDHQTLFELARVGLVLGREDEAVAFLARAQQVGETGMLVFSRG
jgi:serine/threonine protein kinase/tetratricopeptide (TPR) repeat protein